MSIVIDVIAFIVIVSIWSAIISSMLSYLICTYVQSLLGSHWINLCEDKEWETAYIKCCKNIIITCFIFTFIFTSLLLIFRL